MNEVLVINKEKGMTSRDVVNEVSRILHIKKVGHTGTLDPLATGVLIICIGKYTKLVEELSAMKKEYIAEVILGLYTDTLDITGNILQKEKAIYTKEKINQVLFSFPKVYEQEVPLYSAIKIKGKKLYEYAREEKNVILPKRKVEIFHLELLDDIVYKNDKTVFKIKCEVSKGTYIRSLVRDIAYQLGTIGVMNSLIRTSQGNYSIKESYTLEDIKTGNYDFVEKSKLFSPYFKVVISEGILNKVKNGMKLKNIYHQNKILFVDKDDNPISLYQVDEKDNTKVKPYKMLI